MKPEPQEDQQPADRREHDSSDGQPGDDRPDTVPEETDDQARQLAEIEELIAESTEIVSRTRVAAQRLHRSGAAPQAEGAETRKGTDP